MQAGQHHASSLALLTEVLSVYDLSSLGEEGKEGLKTSIGVCND